MLAEKWVLSVLQRLADHGYQAVLVGGCVRDGLLGKKPSDYDIATSATPEQVSALFDKTIPMGRFGTVCVILPAGKVEITTFRADGKYGDYRHPAGVRFGVSLAEDVCRRDFTVNALCFDGCQIIDLCGGQADLQHKIIRAVGNPYERFEEDPLRILRAFRFAAVLDFEIESKTRQAAEQKAHLLEFISAERIGAELDRLIVAEHPEKGMDVFSLLPAGFEKTQVELWNLEPMLPLRWAGFFYRSGISAPAAESFLRQIKRPKKLCTGVFEILQAAQQYHDVEKDYVSGAAEKSGWDSDSRLLRAYGPETVRLALRLCAPERVEHLDALLHRGVCYKREMLALSGNDLLRLGVLPRQMNGMFDKMLDFVWQHPSKNTTERLERFIREHKNGQ